MAQVVKSQNRSSQSNLTLRTRIFRDPGKTNPQGALNTLRTGILMAPEDSSPQGQASLRIPILSPEYYNSEIEQ